MTPNAQFTYPLLIGILLGGAVASLVWIVAFIDYRERINSAYGEIIDTKDRIIAVKEQLIMRLK